MSEAVSSIAVSCDMMTSFDDAASLREAWDACALRCGSPVYMSFDWCRTWWEFYGRGSRLRICVFRQPGQGELLGVLPLYLVRLGPPVIGLTVARLVGSNIPPKVFNPPLDASGAPEMLREALRRVFADGADLLSLGPVAEGWAEAAGVGRVADPSFAVSSAPAGVYTVIDLPPSYDTYIKDLPKKERYYIKKDETRLCSGEFDLKVVTETAPASLEPEFEAFAAQHARQWQAEGKAGHFGSWPDGLAYNRELTRRLGALGRARLMRLETRRGVVARQYVFVFGGAYYWELPAREIGEEWSSLSLGRISAALMLKAAIAEGVGRIEAGMGQYDYKNRMNARECAAVTYRFTARRAGSRLRAALFRGWSAAYRLAVHKVWYRRVMPRLPARWRSGQGRRSLALDF